MGGIESRPWSPRPRTWAASVAGLIGLATLAAPAVAGADTTIEAESMRLRPGVVRPDPAASGGRVAALLRRGSATKTVKVDGVERIVILARGDSCPRRPAGAPKMLVRINGRRVVAAGVAASGFTAYVVERALAPGRHRIRIAYRRDHRARGCDRNLWLDKLTLVGGGSAPPAPAHAPTPTLGPQPPALWLGDFETGSLSQWDLVQAAAADRIRVVPDLVRQGRFATRFEVRDGDNKGGERAELARTDMKEKPGTEYFYGWSTHFAPNFPSTGGWQEIIQWKGDNSGSPPLAVDVDNNVLKLQAGPQASDRTPLWKTTLERGRWLDFVVHVKWSPDAKVGFVEMWFNGAKVLERRSLNTMYPGKDNYLKQGLYRSTNVSGPSVLWHDGMRVGTSYEAVAAR